jgi:hypothetical protein
VEALYRKADADNSNDVSEEELASYLVGAHKDGELSKVGSQLRGRPRVDVTRSAYHMLCLSYKTAPAMLFFRSALRGVEPGDGLRDST